MQVPTDVLQVLDRAEPDGNTLRLTGPPLARDLYVRTAKVIDAAGGKWNRKAGAHLFDGDAAEAIEQIVLTGQVVSRKQQFGYFPTPVAIVQQLLDLAEIKPGMTALEPSAGRGAIAYPLAAAGAIVDCYEIQPDHHRHLLDHRPATEPPLDATLGDFLTTTPAAAYDRVVMNPPFARQDDIRHVTHAHRFLKPGGRLVAVMSNGITFRDTPLTRQFHALLNGERGVIHPLPDGAFQESGTGVRSVIAVIPRTA